MLVFIQVTQVTGPWMYEVESQTQLPNTSLISSFPHRFSLRTSQMTYCCQKIKRSCTWCKILWELFWYTNLWALFTALVPVSSPVMPLKTLFTSQAPGVSPPCFESILDAESFSFLFLIAWEKSSCELHEIPMVSLHPSSCLYILINVIWLSRNCLPVGTCVFRAQPTSSDLNVLKETAESLSFYVLGEDENSGKAAWQQLCVVYFG